MLLLAETEIWASGVGAMAPGTAADRNGQVDNDRTKELCDFIVSRGSMSAKELAKLAADQRLGRCRRDSILGLRGAMRWKE